MMWKKEAQEEEHQSIYITFCFFIILIIAFIIRSFARSFVQKTEKTIRKKRGAKKE